jgi:hypothetical protein
VDRGNFLISSDNKTTFLINHGVHTKDEATAVVQAYLLCGNVGITVRLVLCALAGPSRDALLRGVWWICGQGCHNWNTDGAGDSNDDASEIRALGSIHGEFIRLQRIVVVICTSQVDNGVDLSQYSWIFRWWVEYFELTYDSESIAGDKFKKGQKYIFFEFPHGIFPMGKTGCSLIT